VYVYFGLFLSYREALVEKHQLTYMPESDLLVLTEAGGFYPKFYGMVNIFGDIRSSNPGDYEGSNCHVWDDRKKLAFPPKYLTKHWTNLDQVF